MREQSLGDIRFGTLARAAEGLTQWRPLLMSFLTLLVFSLLVALGASMLTKTVFLSGIIMLIALIALMAGSSAVGIMLMDKAKNEPIRSFAAAASAGLLCLPKFILVGLIVFAATLAYGLVAAIIYFVCKIPFLGGIVAFVAHPILVLVAAALLIAMIWVIGPLMGPALWSGLSVKAALANVLSIARKRLVEVVLMEVVLYIILTLICVMLFAGLVPATMSLTAMAMGITSNASSMSGFGGGMGGMGGYGMGSSMMGMMMGSGASTGLISGLGVLFAVIGALLAQVAVMGMNLIYLQARESVDPTEAEDALDGLIGDVRKKAEEAKAHTMAAAERTMAAAERAKQAASDRLQEASAKNPAANTVADTAVNAEPVTPTAPTAPTTAATAATGAAAVAAAGFAATASDQALADQQAQDRAAAAAAAEAHARQAAEEEAARLRTEAEVARVRADAEAARLKAEAEAQAQAQLQAQQAQAERAAQERAEAQAAEASRQRAQAEAAERAAAAQAAQAAEEAREQANAARRASELQAQHEAEKREAERLEAAAREAARVKAEAQAQAQVQAEEKARQSQALIHCPACKATVAPDDVFCGECGHKLK